MNIKKLCYELYKLDWKQSHNITNETEKKVMRDYQKYLIDDSYTYEDYIEEFGYDGNLYVCFEEFCDNEYHKTDYMCALLIDNYLINMYYKDIGRC